MKDGKTDEKFEDESMAVGPLNSPYQLMKCTPETKIAETPDGFCTGNLQLLYNLDAHCQVLRYIVIFKFETVCRLLSLACM